MSPWKVILAYYGTTLTSNGPISGSFLHILRHIQLNLQRIQFLFDLILVRFISQHNEFISNACSLAIRQEPEGFDKQK